MKSDENEKRLSDIKRFYELLDQREKRVGRKRVLAYCNGRMNWPERGVYFFFEPGELRTTSGEGMRVVRIGTHALVEGGKSTLWKRLRKHRGNQRDGGGSHRGSVFRLHVGAALIARDGWSGPPMTKWGKKSNLPQGVRKAEFPLEKAVSNYIRKMPFLWLEVYDDPGPDSKRGYVELNSIALLSNYWFQDEMIDPASSSWLGKFAKNEDIQHSGLWNSDHVRDGYDPYFLDYFQARING